MNRQRLKRLLQKKGVVLMYHRIAEPPTDPWGLCVSAARFEEQLQVLCKRYKVISVAELLDQHARGRLLNRTVCLTFDDGYLDNYLYAKPLLEKYGCPASFFLPTHFIGLRQAFWWDELEYIFLRAEQLPAVFSLAIHQQPFHVELGGEAILTAELRQKLETWSAYNKPTTRRCELYYEIWKLIRPLPHGQIVEAISRIKEWAGIKVPLEENELPMTEQQMRELQAQPLFEIGLHTVTHPELSAHPAGIQQEEMTRSMQYFKDKLGAPVGTLAYPYGRYNNDTLAIVKKLGLSAAFTTFDEPVTKRSDPYQLGRFQVQNWNGAEFDAHLCRWAPTWFNW
ncbi:MAG: polysaccharide deacetylase family protein [Williamsia sp.]|nr:polysaccharide deacetylase family protein [Williamsia sp.]